MPTRIERIHRGSLACWQIHTPGARLLVAEQGAQLLEYGVRGEAPLIWLSRQAGYQTGQPVRGGVPLCWPWFGDLKRNPPAVQAMYRQPEAAPFHGLARSVPWSLQDMVVQGDALGLTFVPDPLTDWPHPLQVALEIHLDQRLSLVLTTHNPGPQPVWLSQALHTYLAVADIRQVRVPALAGCRYVDALRDWQAFIQPDALTFAGETDRLYLDPPARLQVDDPAGRRRIYLEAQGSRSAVVWNPWTEKSRRLSQFDPQAWRQMLCIETANVLDDCVELAAGARCQLGVSLWSGPA